MQKIKNIGPGMIPLLILIVAEWIWGMKVGLWVALAYGVLELAYFWIKHQRFEKSTIADIGLIVGLGVVALLLEGELLEQIKPLIYLSILLLLVGVSVFSKHNILLSASGRMFKGKVFSPFELYRMETMMRSMFYWMSVYFIILLISILFLSEKFTDFFNGTAIYIAIGCYFIFTFLFSKYQNARYAKEEWIPLIKEDGSVIGHAPRSLVHKKRNRWLHPVVHLQVVGDGGVWLQKRALDKLVQPGKWDSAVGGHISANETVENALLKETWQEINLRIEGLKVHFLGRYQWETEIEREMIYSFGLYTDKEFFIKNNEVEELRLWKFEEIETNKGSGVFTPNFEYEYSLYKSKLLEMDGKKEN